MDVLKMCNGLLSHEEEVSVLYEAIYAISDKGNFMMNNRTVDFISRDILETTKEDYKNVDLSFILDVLEKTKWDDPNKGDFYAEMISDDPNIIDSIPSLMCVQHIMFNIIKNNKL